MNRGLAKIFLIAGVVIALGGVAGWWYLNNQSNISQAVAASPESGNAPLKVDFSVSASDSSATNGIYYTIVFGDGEAAGFSRTSTLTLSHTYMSPGIYTATVTRRTECSSWECLGLMTTVGTATIVVR